MGIKSEYRISYIEMDVDEPYMQAKYTPFFTSKDFDKLYDHAQEYFDTNITHITADLDEGWIRFYANPEEADIGPSNAVIKPPRQISDNDNDKFLPR